MILTKENERLEMQSAVSYIIDDPIKTVYDVADLPTAIQTLVAGDLQRVAKEFELSDICSQAETLSRRVHKRASAVGDAWGITIRRVTIRFL